MNGKYSIIFLFSLAGIQNPSIAIVINYYKGTERQWDLLDWLLRLHTHARTYACTHTHTHKHTPTSQTKAISIRKKGWRTPGLKSIYMYNERLFALRT